MPHIWLPRKAYCSTTPASGGGSSFGSGPGRASTLMKGRWPKSEVIALDIALPMLRQVRLGPTQGDRVEILSGVSAGERIALDPQAAARVR